MQSYADQQALITTIDTTYAKFIAEFAALTPADRDRVIAGVDRTPGQMLAYNIGWTALLLDWKKQEQAGQTVQMPAPGYRWNALGGLYQHFYDAYQDEDLAALQAHLTANVTAITAWIANLSDQEFFEPAQRHWATTPAQWPLWKWIHINTVAPFRTFRTQIRKWQRLANATEQKG